ncbi:MAG: DUF4389 domain-containing protein [Acidobacteriota bacterium]|nr:DUF4389 domain-containing protein [Acidobacteriota bacterium]
MPLINPVSFSVDVPEGPRNRLTCAFRLVLAIPILIVSSAVGGGSVATADHHWAASTAGGLLFFGPALMIVFRQKYPRWWFDWNYALMRFSNRVGAYVLLLRDDYPSTDEEQGVHLELTYPDATQLNQWLPLVKWFLVIPHIVVLAILDVGAVFALIGAWFAVVLTGTYPEGIYRYLVGLMRWHNRVVAYAFVLVTDEYPPFSLAP